MAYTLKQIYATLAGAGENGTEMLADLQQEIANIRNEAAKRRTEKQDILKALSLDDTDNVNNELQSIKTALQTLKEHNNNPQEIGKQLQSLTEQVKNLTNKAEEAEKAKLEEHNKRISETKLNKALQILQENNAANPRVISKLIMDKLVNKDDDSIVYVDGDKELSVENGVKSFLQANPYLIKNTQQPGGGSGSNTNTSKIYTREQIETMTPEQINSNWADVQESMKNF